MTNEKSNADYSIKYTNRNQKTSIQTLTLNEFDYINID